MTSHRIPKTNAGAAPISLLHPREPLNLSYFDAALGLPDAAGAAGLAAACGVAVTAGEGTVPGDAGLKPRLLGLLIIVVAKLLTTLASFIAVSSKAAFKISLR